MVVVCLSVESLVVLITDVFKSFKRLNKKHHSSLPSLSKLRNKTEIKHMVTDILPLLWKTVVRMWPPSSGKGTS